MTWGSGRFWAYVGVALGLSASLAANYAHTNVPPPGAPAEWSPSLGAVVLSLCWPVLLFVAVEVMVKTEWPQGGRWTAVRYLGLLPVAGVAAFVSYRHMSGLLEFYGEDALVSTIGPLAIDGLMIMATGALLATHHVNETEQLVQLSDVGKPSAKPDLTRASDELTELAAGIAQDLRDDGLRISRRLIVERLRAQGHPISNARAGALLRSLRQADDV
jgi:hypothetical protein